MTDPTFSAIDRFFDFVDSGVAKLEHAFNRGKQTEEKHRARHAKHAKRPKEINAEGSLRSTKNATASAGSTALARKAHFYIVESITPSGTLFVVTDGGSARTECSTREFAEKILAALERKS